MPKSGFIAFRRSFQFTTSVLVADDFRFYNMNNTCHDIYVYVFVVYLFHAWFVNHVCMNVCGFLHFLRASFLNLLFMVC